MGTLKSDNYISWTPLKYLAGGALVIWLISLLIIYKSVYKGNEPAAGQLGDVMNIVGSLTGMLTLAGLFFTIMLQRKELHDTRQELMFTRNEYRQQRFESTFFNMIQMVKKQSDDFDYTYTNEKEVQVTARGTIAWQRLLIALGKLSDKLETREHLKEVQAKWKTTTILMTQFITSLDVVPCNLLKNIRQKIKYSVKDIT